MFLLAPLIWILLGTTTAYLAKRRGRHVIGWFCIGLFFGIFGLLLLLFLPNRMPSPINKKTIPVVAEPDVFSIHQDKLWYYLDMKNEQKGPMSFDALKRAWKEGHVLPETYVWNEALDGWKRFSMFLEKKTATSSPLSHQE